MLQRIYISLLFLTIIANVSMAQVKIGDNPAQINPHALLEFESKNKGLILSKVDTDKWTTLTAAEEGMLVYDPLHKRYVFWTGKEWIHMSVGKFFQGNTDIDQAVYIAKTKGNTKLGIGLKDPQYILHIDADADISDTSDNIAVTPTGQLIIGSLPAKSRGSMLEINNSKGDRGIIFPIISNPSSASNEQLKKEAMVAYDKIYKAPVYYDGNKWGVLREKFRAVPSEQNFIFYFKSNELSGRAGGEEFVIADDGKVGIGLKNPINKLDVRGDVRSGDIVYANKRIALINNDKLDKKVLTSDKDGIGTWKMFPLVFQNDNVNKIVHSPFESGGSPNNRHKDATVMIKDNGAVGIGIENTELENAKGDFRFIVAGGATAFRTKRTAVVSANSFKDILATASTDITGKGFVIDSRYSAINGNQTSLAAVPDGKTTGGTNIAFYTADNKDASSLKERLRIDKDGNIGIGIVPAEGLHFPLGKTFRMEEGAKYGYNLMSDANGVGSWEKYNYVFVNDFPKNILYVPLKSDNTTSRAVQESITIKDNGNVSLGTLSLSEKLEVSGKIKISHDAGNNKKAALEIENVLTASSATNPNVTLSGTIKITNKNQAKARVLTSDKDGNATWKPPGIYRVTTAERNAIAVKGTANTNKTGFLVYDTDLKKQLVWRDDVWVSPGMEPGMRMYWSKDINSIPKGWEILNDTDAQNSVMVAAGTTYIPDTKAPTNPIISASSSLGFNTMPYSLKLSQLPSHNHTGYTRWSNTLHKHEYKYATFSYSYSKALLSVSSPSSGNYISHYKLSTKSMPMDSKYMIHDEQELRIAHITSSSMAGEHNHKMTKDSRSTEEHEHKADMDNYKWHVSGYLIEYVGL